MSQKDRPGRNDPCSCGSGRKYKHCCESHSRRMSFTSWVAIAALVAAALLLLFHLQREALGDRDGRGRGDCPAGQVWSDADGHCHEVGG